MLDTPEFHMALLQHCSTTKDRELRGRYIADMQRDMLETLGFEREHGCKMLERIPQDFPEDQEMSFRMRGWVEKAQKKMLMIEQQILGKQMAEEMEKNPDMKRAREEVEGMTPKERGELIERMGKKVQVLQGLPEAARKQHLEKLVESDRLEYMKAQILAFSVMQQQAQHLRVACPTAAGEAG